MIKFENCEVVGWEHAIRGMRNPMNSWEKSDSFECVENVPVFDECEGCPLNHGEEPHNFCIRKRIGATHVIGPNDHELMMKLAKGGPVHAKYRRMIEVYVDIVAPLYWWKEFDTYKVGTVANSCSTMHKIHAKEFTVDDFSHEKLIDRNTTSVVKVPMIKSPDNDYYNYASFTILELTIEMLNKCREMFIETNSKQYWWQMIQLLPSSYNQRRTVKLNYEVLTGIYPMRKNHKLDEWVDFCKWIESLPYSELITGAKDDE